MAIQHTSTTKEQLFHLSVKAIIKNMQGDILLLRRPHETKWDIPGGRINANEQPSDALLREIKEETGLSDLEQIQAHNIELTSVTVVGEENVRLLIWYHTCFCATTDVVLSDEHAQYAWVPWHIARTMIAPLGQTEHINYIVSSWVGHSREQSGTLER